MSAVQSWDRRRMALDSLRQTDVRTRLGPVRLWMTPESSNTERPLVFAIPSVLSSVDDLTIILNNLGLLADGCLMGLPSGSASALSACSMAELSRLVGELIEARFADRRVVALGVSTGAVIALGVRAANLARIVAVEPPLVTRGLWPVIQPLREHLRKVRDPVANAFILEAFGVSEDRTEALSHLGALRDLEVPVEVVLGETPLQPQRELNRFPSLVDEPERRFLAALPGVRLHLARGAGHNVLGHALQVAHDVVQEACRRAGTTLSPARLRLDEPLAEAVPLTARSVLYRGSDDAAFVEALGRSNPKCAVTLVDAATESETPVGGRDGFEAVVLAEPVSAAELARLAPAVRPSGHLIARWGAPDGERRAVLAQNGLVLRGPVDEGGTGVVRAQRPPLEGEVRPALFLQTVACAPMMMDIRTRLPAQGLRSDPDLQVVYTKSPFTLPKLPVEAAKVLVLQLPTDVGLEFWRPIVARVIRAGWVVVLEYDDYPPLIAEIKGIPRPQGDLDVFGYMHGVQTSTPPLVELFRPYNPETMAFPNAAFDLLPFPHGPRPRRVFYGAMLRGRYAIDVAASLGPAIEQFPDTEFVVIGDREVFNALPTASKRYYEYMSFEAYLELMSQCSISLSPIEALPLRETKSDAKFLDAARAGVLTIASPTIYDRVIEHGVNGFLAPEITDWAPLLARALSDGPLRERLAYAAWTYVRQERMFADQVGLRRDWYVDLWARRRELTDALMSRMPGLREAVSG
jgi:Glycosyl transferases group 1